MNKKLFVIIFIIIFCLTACGKNNIDKKSKHSISNDVVSLEVKENTLTDIGATFIIKNKSAVDTYMYGYPYFIEKKENGEWYVLETINELAFNLPAFGLKPSESKELEINWEYGYGKLKSGTYRLVKDVFRSGDEPIGESNIIYIAAEFTVE